jgi:hypothetical protein
MNRDYSFEFVTRAEVVRRTGIGRRQLDRAFERGDLRLYKIGGWKRVRLVDVLQWIASQRVDPPENRVDRDSLGRGSS